MTDDGRKGQDQYQPKSRAERIARRTGAAAPTAARPADARPVATSAKPADRPAPLAKLKPSRLPFHAWRITVGPAAIGSLGFLFVLLLGWGLAMAGIAFLSDRMTPKLIAQQNDLQENYEQKVSALQAEVQRLQAELESTIALAQAPSPSPAPEAGQERGSQPPDPTTPGAGTQEGVQQPAVRPAVEGKIIELARTLARLELRVAAMTQMTEAMQTTLPGAGMSLPQPLPGAAPPPPSGTPVARVPANTSAPAAPARDRRAAARAAGAPEIPDEPAVRAARPHDNFNSGSGSPLQFWQQQLRPPERRSDNSGRSDGPLAILPAGARIAEIDPAHPEQAVRALEQRMGAVDGNLVTQAGAFSAALRTRVDLIKAAIVELEVDMPPPPPVAARSTARAASAAAALPPSERGTPFAQKLEETRNGLSELAALRPLISSVPFARPVAPGVRITSKFGTRSDPFLGTTRFHSGQDFGGPTGTPVIATGSGVVLSAGWGGGYGNLVQVDHGNGIVTRYAHLHEIKVAPGQPVARGHVVGLVGSTGRSTGPHLHYETRIEGEATDPMDFIESGSALGVVR